MLAVYEMLKVFGCLEIRRLLFLHLTIHLQEGKMLTGGTALELDRGRARAKEWQKSRRKKSYVYNG